MVGSQSPTFMTDDELISVLEHALKDGRYDRDDLYLFDTKTAWQLTHEAHVHDAQRDKVIAALEAHPDIAPLLGMHLNGGGINAPKLDREPFGGWLLTRAAQIGAVAAVTELRAFLDSQFCELEEYLAFSGLETVAPISLPEGVDLVPITAVPESVFSISLTDPDWFCFRRNAKGQVLRKTVQILAQFGTSAWHIDPHVAMAALRIRHKMRPKVVPAPIHFTNSTAKMFDSLRVLAADACTAMFPVAHWISPSPTTPLWNYFASTQWYHLNSLRPFATTKGNEARIAAIATAWEVLPEQVKSKLIIPLDRLNRALAAPLAVDCAIDLGLALEALLLSDLLPNDQISLAFRLRGAWLLGTTPTERKHLLRQFNHIYTCRSSAVHSGTLPSDKLQVNGEKVSAYDFTLKHARPLAARAILRVIALGEIPDWSALLVGAGE